MGIKIKPGQVWRGMANDSVRFLILTTESFDGHDGKGMWVADNTALDYRAGDTCAYDSDSMNQNFVLEQDNADTNPDSPV